MTEFEERALLLVGLGVHQRLLADHVADRSGRCKGCVGAQGAGPVWPCSLARLAERAEQIVQGKRARARS
jgi:hypothetical protein